MRLLEYNEENLAVAFSNDYTTPQVISAKNHFLYFKDYFSPQGLNAKMMVVEDNYVSKDFLHDYASYYAFCFENYPKTCRRIHFFDVDFTEEKFNSFLLNADENSDNFWSHYLGFIVIKPIPVTVIGFTVLKTYAGNHAFNERNFWGTRQY